MVSELVSLTDALPAPFHCADFDSFLSVAALEHPASRLFLNGLLAAVRSKRVI